MHAGQHVAGTFERSGQALLRFQGLALGALAAAWFAYGHAMRSGQQQVVPPLARQRKDGYHGETAQPRIAGRARKLVLRLKQFPRKRRRAGRAATSEPLVATTEELREMAGLKRLAEASAKTLGGLLVILFVTGIAAVLLLGDKPPTDSDLLSIAPFLGLVALATFMFITRKRKPGGSRPQ